MKRVLRILLLGPIWLVAAVVFTVVSPLVALLVWLIDDEPGDLREFLGWVWTEPPRFLWTGEMEP